MRSPVDNPFTPGSDTVPAVWAGRQRQVSDWTDVVRPRRMAGIAERGRTILGEPGLGKSTLVRLIANKAEASGDWATPQIRIPSGADPLKAVASAILGLADRAGLAASREKHIRDMMGRVRQIAASGISLTIDRSEGAEPYAALTQLLVEVGKEALSRGSMVLIHIDEVQNIADDDTLSQLLISLGDAITATIPVPAPGQVTVESALPIAVYLTGLPEFAETASSRSGATFARRFATTVLEPISDGDLAFALTPFVSVGWEVLGSDGIPTRVRMEQEAANKIVELCQGEPFLFQLAGERAWYAGTGDVITLEEVISGWADATYEATAHVERILERLPAKERELIETMAALPEDQRKATLIAQKMGYQSASSIGPLAQRLDTVRGIISRGTTYAFRHRAVEAYLAGGWPA